MEPVGLSPDPPPGQTEVERLTWLLDQARTFYFQYDDLERVSESIAVSHLLTVASHPDLGTIYEAAHRLAKAYGNGRPEGDWDDYQTYQLLHDLLNLVFDRAPDAGKLTRQPEMLTLLEGRIRLKRPYARESLVFTGHWPTFIDRGTWWCDNPRRDLTPYFHEIMTPEELRAEWRMDGAMRACLSSPTPDTPTVKALLTLLRSAAEAYTPGSDSRETIEALVAVAREADTQAIRRAGARLLLSDSDRKQVGAILAILFPLLFGRRRHGKPDEYPMAPLSSHDGRLVLAEDFGHGPSPNDWEGEMVVRTKLYERRDLSTFGSMLKPA